MPKHNLHSVKKDIGDNTSSVSYVEKVIQEKSAEPKTIALQLQIEAKVNVTGYVTGNSYIFDGAGSVVYVDERDVENLLEKRQGGRQCCGGTGFGNAVFSLAEVI